VHAYLHNTIVLKNNGDLRLTISVSDIHTDNGLHSYTINMDTKKNSFQ
jgi:hypothetical protein